VMMAKYAQKTAYRLGVPEDAVRTEFRKLSRSHFQPRPVQPDVEAQVPEKPLPREQRWLLKLLLVHDEFLSWAATNIDPQWLANELARDLLERLLDIHRQGLWKNVAGFLDECSNSATRNFVTEVILKDVITDIGYRERDISTPGQQLADTASRLRKEWIEAQMAALTHEGNQPETSEARRVELVRKRLEFLNQKGIRLKAPQ